MRAKDDHEETWRAFRERVKMTPKEIERWPESDGSKEADLTDAQWAHMAKVVGYTARHPRQRPKGDVEDTKWRHSLMNWGHDPLK